MSIFLDLCADIGGVQQTSLERVTMFIEIGRLLKPLLLWLCPLSDHDPPTQLSPRVHVFMKDCLSLTDDECMDAWTRLRFRAWENLTVAEALGLRLKYMQHILDYGLSQEIGTLEL